MITATHSLSLAGQPGLTVDVTLTERGAGHPVLLLHGGAGPLSVAGFAERLGAGQPARVLTPTHPGFGGTPRPDPLASIGGLAALYVALLERLDLREVTVIGNSIGGWVAAEMALLDASRIGRLVLVDAVGIVVEGHPVADVFSLSLPELMQLSYHDPAPFRVDPSTFSDAQRAGMAANRAALAVYGGKPSVGDPTLRGRLAGISVPTLVVWGESDRVVDSDYGRAYAAAIPGARFQLLPATGHVPQIETPDQLLGALGAFVAPRALPPAPSSGSVRAIRAVGPFAIPVDCATSAPRASS
jgi:pimeloyl-ACP methyl ester carboxylesterase